MSRARRIGAVVFARALFGSLALLALPGCESREDANRRVVAEAEARVYSDEAARSGDRGARMIESAQAGELARLHLARASAIGEIKRKEDFLASAEAKRASKDTIREQTRLLGEDKKRLLLTDETIEIQRKLVEANRDRLTRLKSETEAALAHPSADAGLSAEILRERLRGVEASLSASTAALAGSNDGG